jgi:molybdopterin adenylyltransferase
MNMIKVMSVNISEKKGTVKHPVDEIIIDKDGIINDAHYGMKNRSISILCVENIREFEAKAGRKINYGEFAENLTLEGINLKDIKLLDKFTIGDAELEVSQIGKECHGSSCAIFKEVGNCIMPKEGIFCRVIKSGKIKAGAEVIYKPREINISIITLSDRASKGEYADRSGPRIQEIVESFYSKKEQSIKIKLKLIPDDTVLLSEQILEETCEKTQIIITTGGTGISPSDITPDTIKPMLDKEIPGIMEMIRMKYGADKPAALLSRSIAGVKDKSLIYTLPGSVKAIEEYMTEILKTLDHLLYTLQGLDIH